MWVILHCKCGNLTKVWKLQHFYERSYHNFKTEKPIFLSGWFGSSSIIYDWYWVLPRKFTVMLQKDQN